MFGLFGSNSWATVSETFGTSSVVSCSVEIHLMKVKIERIAACKRILSYYDLLQKIIKYHALDVQNHLFSSVVLVWHASDEANMGKSSSEVLSLSSSISHYRTFQ
jgi:hypothetical protein